MERIKKRKKIKRKYIKENINQELRTNKIKTIRAAKVIIVIRPIKLVKYIKVAIFIYIASFKKVRVIKRILLFHQSLVQISRQMICVSDNNQLSEVFYCRNSVAVWQQCCKIVSK